DVGRRIRASRAANRRLIDELNVLYLIDALQCCDFSDFQTADAAEFALVPVVKAVADEGRLAGSRDAGDGHHFAERDTDVDVLEVVFARAADDQCQVPSAECRVSSRSVTRHSGLGTRHSLVGHLAAELPGPRPQLDGV